MRTRSWFLAIAVFVSPYLVHAGTATFDFDTGMPALSAGQSTPFDQTAGGVTAHFQAVNGWQGFSVQSDASTGFMLPRFSGLYLYPNGFYSGTLSIQFDQRLNSIALSFATGDFQQVEVPTLVQLTAYLDSTAVGSATAHGKYGQSTMPLGRLSFAPGAAFNRVEIAMAPGQAFGSGEILVDNIEVTTVPPPPPAAPAVGPNVNLTKAQGNQYETSVAINPQDNSQVFVVSRNETGGLYTARSSDGGATWTSQLIATATPPQPGDIPRAYGNASAAWDAFGNLFLAYLSQAKTDSPATYVTLAVSTDGGASFHSPAGEGAAVILPDTSPALPGDRPKVAAGPGSAGFPGSIWVTYSSVNGIWVSGAGVSGIDTVGAFISQLLPAAPEPVNFSDIAVGPGGEAIVTYGPSTAPGSIYINVDADGLGPDPFQPCAPVLPVNIGAFTMIPAQPNWGIDPEAGLAWDQTGGAHSGRVYLVYTDAPEVGSADTDIFVTYSDDRGASWSGPVRVNDDTGTNSQFLPHISIDQSTGIIAVTWYDARNSASNDTAEYYGAFSMDGGATFGANFPVSSGTSNQARSTAALKKADYGDYSGNAFVNGRLVAAWADNSDGIGDNPDGPTEFDVYGAVVQPPAIPLP